MPFAPYVPLRVLSSFTMLEGAIEPAAAAKLAREQGFPAIAICDRNGLYGALPFAAACRKEGVQPIIGALLGVARDEDGRQVDFLPLFAQDETGYDNLSALVSRAHLDRPALADPHIRLNDLKGRTNGLIALTGAGEGAVSRLLTEGQASATNEYLAALQTHFADRLYVELARIGDPVQEAAEAALIDLAYAHDLPLVATNPACFAEPGFSRAHDAMLCIAASTHIEADDRVRTNEEGFVRSASMMEERFADLPEAVANTLIIAQRCAVAPPRRAPILPSLAGDAAGEVAMLKEQAAAGLAARLSCYEALSDEDRREYDARLELEIEVIVQKGFPGYFLIVADFIQWAKDNGIPVGPGRGSGAGSLVAWALKITDLDPIRLGLLFERFLNPERESMPDFDVDFCETRRGEVIRYVQEKYGADRVAQIITFGRMKARAVLRDCGRILQMGYNRVDQLCKQVPNHPTDPWTLKRALNGVAEFRRAYDNDDEVRRLVDLAMQLEGLPRNSSTHAAGVVIGDRPLQELVPLYRDPGGDMPVTQFDMNTVEQTGLVKFDFLGLKTLSVLRRAVDLLEARGISIDLSALPLDDEAVYRLMQSGDTVGVFQLESEGMRRTLSAVKPTAFEDIIALVSLYRPGPMDNIPLFGRRKNGEEPVAYPHPKLEAILAETQGIFIYQEQVMQAAQLLAGYSLGEADLLRRAMGKKKQSEMDAQRQRFVDGCGEVSKIDPKGASALFDLIDKFAGYGFNKSHAAAYALLAYQTGWLKAHYPHEFYAASMAFECDHSEKLALFVDDARRHVCADGGRVALLPPDINRSDANFTVEQTDAGPAVRYALAGIKNVGRKAMEAIVAEREASGWFESVDDLFARLPAGTMNRRQLEGLIGAGAFDRLEPNRAKLFDHAELLMAHAEASARERTSGQGGLFGAGDDEQPALRLRDTDEWPRTERMAKERESFGFFFSAHPVEEHRAVASANGARSYAALMEAGAPAGGRMAAVMAAMVEGIRIGRTRKGGTFVRADFSDASGQFSAACFEEALVPKFEEWAEDGTCILLQVELDSPSPGEAPRVTVRGARPLSEVSGGLPMILTCDVSDPEAFSALAELLPPEAGKMGEVQLRLRTGGEGDPVLHLGKRFALDGALADRIGTIDGVDNVTLAPRRGPERLRLVA